MTRYQTQITYSLLMTFTGGIIASHSNNPSQLIQYILSTGLLLSACFIFISAAKIKNSKLLVKYHQWLGVGMVAFALSILFYATAFKNFILVTMAFLLYFGITEILYGFQLLEYKRKPGISMIILRMITGLFVAVGAVTILASAFFDQSMSLLFTGILISLSGINFVLFANATRKL